MAAPTRLKCPWCKKTYAGADKAGYSHHISTHVADEIGTRYPGLTDTIKKVETEMPVKFLLKVDVDRALADADASVVADEIIRSGDEEAEAGS